MTIAQALQSYSNYPVPSLLLQRVAAERGLALDEFYDSDIAASKSYRLAKADVYYYYGTAPDIKEGDISLSLSQQSNFLFMAKAIYQEYRQTTKQSNITEAGYIGENF